MNNYIYSRNLSRPYHTSRSPNTSVIAVILGSSIPQLHQFGKINLIKPQLSHNLSNSTLFWCIATAASKNITTKNSTPCPCGGIKLIRRPFPRYTQAERRLFLVQIFVSHTGGANTTLETSECFGCRIIELS